MVRGLTAHLWQFDTSAYQNATHPDSAWHASCFTRTPVAGSVPKHVVQSPPRRTPEPGFGGYWTCAKSQTNVPDVK